MQFYGRTESALEGELGVPYFLVTGAHPTIPLDVVEATWLVKPPTGIITEMELIGLRACALAKHRIHVEQMLKHINLDKLKRLKQYERDYRAVIKDYKFEWTNDSGRDK